MLQSAEKPKYHRFKLRIFLWANCKVRAASPEQPAWCQSCWPVGHSRVWPCSGQRRSVVKDDRSSSSGMYLWDLVRFMIHVPVPLCRTQKIHLDRYRNLCEDKRFYSLTQNPSVMKRTEDKKSDLLTLTTSMDLWHLCCIYCWVLKCDSDCHVFFVNQPVQNPLEQNKGQRTRSGWWHLKSCFCPWAFRPLAQSVARLPKTELVIWLLSNDWALDDCQNFMSGWICMYEFQGPDEPWGVYFKQFGTCSWKWHDSAMCRFAMLTAVLALEKKILESWPLWECTFFNAVITLIIILVIILVII